MEEKGVVREKKQYQERSETLINDRSVIQWRNSSRTNKRD